MSTSEEQLSELKSERRKILGYSRPWGSAERSL